jgi:hypothetical protein
MLKKFKEQPMTQELNCSDAAKMLIERMTTHPEDFKPGERFWRVMQIINGEGDMGFEPVMSKRDLDALTTAAQQLFEATFMEYVLHKLLVKEERVPTLGQAMLQKGKTNTITSPAQMALQGSSLMSSMTKAELQQRLQNQYQNMYPSGTTTGRFGAK